MTETPFLPVKSVSAGIANAREALGLNRLCVPLPEAEIVAAAKAGAGRRARALCRNRQSRSRDEGVDLWSYDIWAALAEATVCRFLGVDFIDATELDHAGDVEPTLQVRYGSAGRKSHLAIYTEDDPTHSFFLVVGSLPALEIVGGIKGADARRDRWWRADKAMRRPCWWVPPGALTQFNSEHIDAARKRGVLA